MTEQPEVPQDGAVEPRPPAAALKFSGPRFDELGTPVEALAEVLAFNALLVEVAKAHFRRSYLRIRVPGGFTDRITLRLMDIEEGSVIPILAAPRTDGHLFSELDVVSELDIARRSIEELIDSAASGISPPSIFRDIPAAVLKRFGQTLRDGEAVQVGLRNDREHWREASKYDRSVRRSILLDLAGTYTDAATAVGTISEIGLEQSSFKLRSDEGLSIPARYSEEDFFSLMGRATASPSTRFQITGVADFGPENQIVRFITVDSIVLTDEEQTDMDFDRALAGVRELATLEAGWLDGDIGSPVDIAMQSLGLRLLGDVRRTNLPAPYVYPTESGGIQFEWEVRSKAISAEVTPGQSGLVLHATDTSTLSFEVERFNLNTPNAIETAMDWLKRQVSAA